MKTDILIIVVIFFLLIIIIYIQDYFQKKQTSAPTLDSSNHNTKEDSEPLLIHCPACGSEISRFAPSCFKCGHPICPTTNPRTTSPKDHNQTIIVQTPVRQSNETGTAGFVLALISLFFSWLPGVGWVIWFLGFLLSFIGMFKSPRGLAVTGFLISIIDLIILIAVVGSIASLLKYMF